MQESLIKIIGYNANKKEDNKYWKVHLTYQTKHQNILQWLLIGYKYPKLLKIKTDFKFYYDNRTYSGMKNAKEKNSFGSRVIDL